MAQCTAGDLASILDHHVRQLSAAEHATHSAGEDSSLTQGTSAWARLSQNNQTSPGTEQSCSPDPSTGNSTDEEVAQ